jgi:riboflavin kinase/FMN adenylyltransferase
VTPDGSPNPCVSTLCAIGNFDGVHRGHVDVLSRAAAEARENGLRPIALTFDPPPSAVLGRTPPAILTPLARKIELIERTGMKVVVKTFDRALAAASPREFAERVLVNELSVRRVVVGQDFRFGQGRAGDLDTLMALGQELGFTAHPAAIVGDAEGPWSSTRARKAIARGDFAEVERVLGRPHALTGVVIHGDQRGRALGFPTANLGEVRELLPPFGVYAVLVDRTGPGARPAAPLLRGVANIGVRPTVGAGPAIEVHLFDLAEDLYGIELRAHLIAFVRGEHKFASLDALKAQISADCQRAREIVAPFERAAGSGTWF